LLIVIIDLYEDIFMGMKRYSSEQIIRLLRQSDILIGQGKTIAIMCRELGITDSTYYKWRRKYGGMQISQAKLLKDLELENSRLKRAVADLTLDCLILKDVASGN
jgi:putative transposase